MMDTVNMIRVVEIDDVDELYRSGQDEPERPWPVTLELSLRSGEMTCVARRPGHLTDSHRHGIILACPIPPLTAAAANEMLAELAPHAQHVLAGASIGRVGDNQVGILDDVAARIWSNVIEARCAALIAEVEDTQIVGFVDPAEWFIESAAATVAELDLTADLTDELLQDLALEQAKAAAAASQFGHAVFKLAEWVEFLTDLRGELRQNVRDELAAAADNMAAATVIVHRLLRRVAGFGVPTDTPQVLAELGGVPESALPGILQVRQYAVAVQVPTGPGELGAWKDVWKVAAYHSPFGDAKYVALDILATSKVIVPAAGTDWRVAVWHASDELTADPMYVLTPEVWRETVIAAADRADAVSNFLYDLLSDGTQWKVADLRAAAEKAGIAVRPQTVAEALARLSTSGRIVQPRYGHYALPAEPVQVSS